MFTGHKKTANMALFCIKNVKTYKLNLSASKTITENLARTHQVNMTRFIKIKNFKILMHGFFTKRIMTQNSALYMYTLCDTQLQPILKL